MRVGIDLALPIGTRSLRVALESDARALAVVGPSGIGKSTLLRAIAGVLPCARGRVVIDGVALQDDARRIELSPEVRRVGWVPQESLLLPHLSVHANVAFSRPSARALAEAIELTGIGELLTRAPSTLSGGERQRVAIARAIARAPRVLLLDEPLAALDRDARATLAAQLAAWSATHDVTTLLVAHDEADVAALASDVFTLGASGVQPADHAAR